VANKMQSETNDIYFLSDQPIETDEISQTKFGHEGIAETIKNIIISCPTRFTIGLFGKWGTGKTTIINRLKNKLQNEKIAVVEFDVWKHEGDALRRTFLKEIVKQLKEDEQISEDFKLTDTLDKTISREFQSKFSFDVSKLKYPIGGMGLAAFVAGLAIYGIWPQHLGIYISYIFGGSLTASILVLVLQQAITAEKITSTTDRFQDPHEFETEFKNIITKIPNDRKLLVIIDNLDRTHHEKAVELLSTIKTFLEHNRCIFLIACDDAAIKKHLESVYANSENNNESPHSYTDEFLRKFFSTFIRIPVFIGRDLQSYTEELLKETRVTKLNDPDVAHIITVAFRDNPRQIKQSINVLLSHYLLAQEREEGANPLIVPEGIITNNVAFLAKLLVISQKYPNEYKEIEGKKLNSDEINNLCKDCLEFREFLDSTKLIPKKQIQNTRPFIYLKQSEQELRIPEADELERALLDGKQDSVKRIFDHVSKSQNDLEEYNKLIVDLIDANTTRPNALFNIVSSSLNALNISKLEFDYRYYNKVADLLSTKLADQLHLFDSSLVFDQVINKCDKRSISGIIFQYAKILNMQATSDDAYIDEWAYELFQKIIAHRELFMAVKDNLSNALSEHYSNTKVLSLFRDREAQEDFISDEIILKFISTISGDDLNNNCFNDKIELLLDFEYVIGPNAIKELIINQFSPILSNENKQPFSEKKENLLDNINEIFGKYRKLITEIDDESVLTTFGDSITQGIDVINDWSQKKIFICICIRLKNLMADPHTTEIDNRITDFWNNTDSDGVRYALEKLNGDERQEVIDGYWNIFRDTSVQLQDRFDTIWQFSNEEKKQDLFQHVINSPNFQWGLNKLKELNHEPDFDKKAAVNVLQSKVESVGISNKSEFYSAINIMECGKDPALQDKHVNQIKVLLKDPNESSQKVGYDALNESIYLPESKRRDVAREIIDWLKLLDSINYSYQHALKSVLLNWNTLPSVPQEHYIDIIFERLIKGSSDINNIELGMEILQQIKPTYTTYSEYFDDMLERLRNEPNIEIKREIKEGLLELKPIAPDESEESFWNHIMEVEI
jgi:GTPase SAR1 family protein